MFSKGGIGGAKQGPDGAVSNCECFELMIMEDEMWKERPVNFLLDEREVANLLALNAMMENTPLFLKEIMVHYVGNRSKLEPLIVSGHPQIFDEMSLALLQEGFLSRFRNNTEYHSFTHSNSLKYHVVYEVCRQLFKQRTLRDGSAGLAKQLYEQSVHPRIKGGEFYVVYFEGLPVESRVHRAIGLFKAENKSMFIEASQGKGAVSLDLKEGVEIGKLDKGCLVIEHHEEEGYDVLVFDQQNKGEEALYWKEKFLGLTPQQNEYHHTANLLALTKQFITGPLETEMKLGRTEQVELLHKSLNYFKSRENFDIEEFQKEVFEDQDKIASFRRFGSQYVEQSDFDIASRFDISVDAVKKQSRLYKSVVKLDRNFHIYIHGRTDLIEKGMDMDGRKFYKIYYQEES